MPPISSHGSKGIISFLILLILVSAGTFMTVRLKLSSQLSYNQRKIAIVKSQIEVWNRAQIKGIDDETD